MDHFSFFKGDKTFSGQNCTTDSGMEREENYMIVLRNVRFLISSWKWDSAVEGKNEQTWERGFYHPVTGNYPTS